MSTMTINGKLAPLPDDPDALLIDGMGSAQAIVEARGAVGAARRRMEGLEPIEEGLHGMAPYAAFPDAAREERAPGGEPAIAGGIARRKSQPNADRHAAARDAPGVRQRREAPAVPRRRDQPE